MQCLAGEYLQDGSSGEVREGEAAGRETLLGDYALVREIDRGGMGVIYEARQISLGRRVAVKTITEGRLASRESLQRFAAESRAAANLRHPNIVAVYEVGEHEGVPFFSMDYIDGGNLGDRVAERPLLPQLAAELAHKIAKAIGAAHSAGIIHRDLKPSNILIDRNSGEPFVSDFGLAKQMDSDSDLTRSGAPVGSPHYLPPEQAGGQTGSIGPASDIYSIGAILYHLITGRPPFLGESLLATLEQVRSSEPVNPRRLNPKIPKDLETICLKCLSKQPAKRYSSAKALVDDLARFLDGRPITARPVSSGERALAWCRRNPWLASMGACALMALLLGASGVLWQWNRAERHANNEAMERGRAESAFRKLTLERVEELLRRNEAGDAIAHLCQMLRDAPEDRAITARLLSELTYRKFVVPVGEPDPLPAGRALRPVFLDQHTVLTVIGRENTLEIRRHHGTAPAEAPISVPLPESLIRGDIARTGDRAFVACENGLACSIDLRQGRVLHQHDLKGADLHSAQISDEGRLGMAHTRAGEIAIWDIDSGEQRALHELGPSLRIALLAGNGQWVTTALKSGPSSSVQLFHTQREGPLGRPMQTRGDVNYLSRSWEDDSILVSCRDGTIESWATPSSTLLGTFRLPAGLRSIRQGRHNLVTAVCDTKGQLQVWTPMGNQLLPSMPGGELRSVDISGDGADLALLTQDRKIHFKRPLDGSDSFSSLHVEPSARDVIFASGSTKLAIATSNSLQIFDRRSPAAYSELAARSPLAHAQGANGLVAIVSRTADGVEVMIDSDSFRVGMIKPPARRAFFSPGLDWLAMTDSAGKLGLWSLTRNKDTGRFQADRAFYQDVRGNDPISLAFDPASRFLVMGHRDGTLQRVDLSPFKITPLYAGRPAAANKIVTDERGDQIAVVWADRHLQVINPSSGQAQGALSLTHYTNNFRFTPNGSQLLLMAPNQLLSWDLKSAHSPSVILDDNSFSALDLSRDGRHAVVGASDRTAVVVDLDDHQVIARLEHGSEVQAVSFSKDGGFLATGTSSGHVQIWDLDTNIPVTSALAQGGSVRRLYLNESNGQLISISNQVRRWWLPIPDGPAPNWFVAYAQAMGDGADLRGSRKAMKDWLEDQNDRSGFWPQWTHAILLGNDADAPVHPSSRTMRSVYGSRLQTYGDDHSLREALVLESRSLPALRELTRRVFHQRNETDTRALLEAASYASTVLQLAPDDTEMRIYAAAALMRLGKLDGARLVIEARSLLPKDDCVALLNLARVCQAIGKVTEAYGLYADAFEAGIHDPNLDGFCREALLERRKLGRDTGLGEKAVREFLTLRGIPPRSPETSQQCIDLSAHYTSSLDEEWHGRRFSGQDLSPLPRHEQMLGEIAFDLRGIIQLSGRTLDDIAPGYPDRVTGIQVGRLTGHLHFLHALGWGEFAHTETHVADYVIHYADGSNATINLINGVHVFEWGNPNGKSITHPGVSVAWHGVNPRGNHNGLYRFKWENPKPEVPIQSIDFVSAGTNAAPFLVGISVE